MIFDRFDELLTLTLGMWFFGMSYLFGLIWQKSRTSMIGRQRTRLSCAQHDLTGGLVIMSFGVGTRYLFRWIKGPKDDAVFEPLPVGIAVQMLLVIGLVVTTWAGVRVFGSVLERTRGHNSGMGISQERILATVAVDLPMIVADQGGIIRYATEPMEELAGAKPGELDGLNTTEIMPERYRAHHTAGMERYLATGQSRIIGKVIDVDLLQRDGTEIPVSLALTDSEADEQHWFIGCIWVRETYDQPGTEGVNIRQDDRENSQNDEDANLEIRRSQQDRRENRLTKRDVAQQTRGADQDVRDHEQAARDVRQDTRDDER